MWSFTDPRRPIIEGTHSATVGAHFLGSALHWAAFSITSDYMLSNLCASSEATHSTFYYDIADCRQG
jgi:hypothetical protein